MTSGLNSLDGAQLQRRALQELERQWLDSWGAASAAQPDAGSASLDQEASGTATTPFTAGDAAAESTHSAAQSGVVTSSARNTGSSKDARAGTRSADRHTASREEARPASASGDDRAGIAAAAFNASEVNSATSFDTQHAQSMNSVGATPDTAALAATQRALAPSMVALPPAIAALPPGLALAAGAALLTGRAESDTDSAPAARPRLPQASEGHVGPQRLTLRELAPDLVQATLRDTQLDLAASQLAAQGLARALMEAGYAQVKVVVNGQHSRGEDAEPGDARPSAATAAAPNAPFSETASKDHAHGN